VLFHQLDDGFDLFDFLGFQRARSFG